MDIIYEKCVIILILNSRNRIKEREKEDALYAGKEKFITSAYKRKLEADRKWMEEVKKKELAKGNKGRFLTNMMNSRADEADEESKDKDDNHGNELDRSQPASNSKVEQPQHHQKQQEEDEEFDGFILAPPEEQIKGNVSEEDSDAGIIRAPEEERERRESRSRSHKRERHRSRSESRSDRSRSRSRRHTHRRHRHHHSYVFKKQTMTWVQG